VETRPRGHSNDPDLPGFFGDTGIQDISPAIHSPNHWRDLMLDHMKGIFPCSNAQLIHYLQQDVNVVAHPFAPCRAPFSPARTPPKIDATRKRPATINS